VAKLLVPALDAWAYRRELLFGAAVMATVLTAFGLAMRIARARRAASAPPAGGD
jgi:hypothetical protein